MYRATTGYFTLQLCQLRGRRGYIYFVCILMSIVFVQMYDEQQSKNIIMYPITNIIAFFQQYHMRLQYGQEMSLMLVQMPMCLFRCMELVAKRLRNIHYAIRVTTLNRELLISSRYTCYFISILFHKPHLHIYLGA